MFYKLFRYVDDGWYLWCCYSDPVDLANVANELGLAGLKTRVEVVKDGMDKR